MEPVGVRLQGLTQGEQVLVLARIADSRGGTGTFAPSDLTGLFEELGLPSPKKISNVFLALEKAGNLTRTSSLGQWKLTPTGRQRSLELADSVDAAALLAEARVGIGSHLAHASHTVIPPSFAPPEFLEPLRQFFSDYPFDRNVFAMTRFPDEGDEVAGAPDPVAPAIQSARDACKTHGLTLHLASERMIVDDLWGNVLAHMWGSRYGIAFFEDRKNVGLNYNLTIEVGGMLITGRRTALLKDTGVKLPTDLVGKIYKSVDLDKPKTVEARVHEWLRDDLRLGECSGCA